MKSELHDNIIRLSGDITVKTVDQAAFGRFEQQCRQSGLIGIDLSKVDKADSACLSLLVAALRQNRNLVFHNIPASVQALSELYEIQEQVHA